MSKNSFLTFLFFAGFYINPIIAQHDYLISFTDKSNSPFTLSEPSAYLSADAIMRRKNQNISILERDLPVNPSYISQLQNLGIKVRYPTKWFNGAIVRITSPSQLNLIAQLAFVSGSTAMSRSSAVNNQLSRVQNSQDKFSVISNKSLNYGSASAQLEMLGITDMHDNGYTGKGIKIAIIDNGFYNADSLACFHSLFASGRLLGYYDVSNDKPNVFDMGNHGVSVFSVLAAYQSGILIGGAYDATYYLYHTEVDATEYPVEEANWLRAAEMADSAGVDIISSSLGYTTFDNSIFDNTYADMNGSTTLISKAANVASQCGILVVNSAGNEGGGDWQYVVSPADASSVLSVGAVDNSGNYAYFSSTGPTSDGRIKPDVSAPGYPVAVINAGGNVVFENGTSFSAPLVASLAAGLWQAYPQLSNNQLSRIIKSSSTIANSPNNQIGFGIPNFKVAKGMLDNNYSIIYPNPSSPSVGTYLWLNNSDINKRMEVNVIDAAGKTVQSQIFEISSQINWLNLSGSLLLPGCYILQVKFPDKVQSHKLIYIN